MSLISTYQSRKSLFAEKLEDKGVEASATDGLTTLINKIEDIEGGFTEGLLLYAENNIVQKDDTVDLYALLLQEGKPLPNKTVDFIGLYTVIAGKVCHVPPHYRFEKFGYMNATVYLDADHHFKIGSGALFYKDDVEQSSAKVYSVEVNQNTLTVGYIGGTTSTFDVSNYDMSVIESTVTISDLICYASGTTGSDGVASYTYTGVGEGLKEVYAKYGTLVSETYEIIDALFYCQGTTGNVNSNWVAETGLTSTPDAEGNLLSNSTTGGKYYASNLPNSSTSELRDFTAPLCIEFTAISGDGVRLFLNTSTGGSNIDKNITSYITGNNKVKMIVRENDYDLIVDGEVKLSNVSHSLVAPFGIRFVVNSNCSLKYKDFRIYPV